MSINNTLQYQGQCYVTNKLYVWEGAPTMCGMIGELTKCLCYGQLISQLGYYGPAGILWPAGRIGL